MYSTTRTRKRYDHRLRDLVRSAGDISHATRLGIPRSTAHGWLTSNRAEIVTVEVANMDLIALQEEALVLKKRIDWLVALLRLMVVLLMVTGISLDYARISDGDLKASLLQAIERSRAVLPLRTVLRVLRLSRSRYHSWKREEDCGLDDMPSCPRSSPQQLTHIEVETIKNMVTSDEYRHVPTATWPSWLNELAVCLLHRQPGSDLFGGISGDVFDYVSILPSRNSELELLVGAAIYVGAVENIAPHFTCASARFVGFSGYGCGYYSL